MRITYSGTGTVQVESVGAVSSGNSIEVPDSIGKALVKQDPKTWSEDRPAPKKQSGRVRADR